MGELHGDEMRTEYEDTKVYSVEDGGERAWYVAVHPWEALKTHVQDCGNEDAFIHPGEGAEVVLCKPDDMFMLVEQEDPDDWPDYWQRTKTEAGSDKIGATFAEWAAFYAATAPQQVGSTEY